MPSPKARLLEQKALVSRHLDTVTSAAFQTAADAALLTVIYELASNAVADPTVAAAHYQRIVGATKFRAILESIADAPLPPPTRTNNDNLNHSR